MGADVSIIAHGQEKEDVEEGGADEGASSGASQQPDIGAIGPARRAVRTGEGCRT